jgi:hypothetical protein
MAGSGEAYHKLHLCEQLVEVINEDYNDFISLSTKLVNVDGAVMRMQKPLLEVKVTVPGSPCACLCTSCVVFCGICRRLGL